MTDVYSKSPLVWFSFLLSLSTHDDLWIRWPSSILQDVRPLHFLFFCFSRVQSSLTLTHAVMWTLMSLSLLPRPMTSASMLLAYKPGTPPPDYPATISHPFFLSCLLLSSVFLKHTNNFFSSSVALRYDQYCDAWVSEWVLVRSFVLFFFAVFSTSTKAYTHKQLGIEWHCSYIYLCTWMIKG